MAKISKAKADRLRAMYRMSQVFSRVAEMMKRELDFEIAQHLNGDTELIDTHGEILVKVSVIEAHVREIKAHTRTTWQGQNTREATTVRDNSALVIKGRYWKH